MKRILLMSLLLLFAFTLPALAQDSDFPRTLTDALGTEVTLDAPPQRIVSLSLGADEVLLPLVTPERFVAVTALSQDPGISNVAVLANQVPNAIASSQDTEQIISLEPDLVIAASFTAPEVVQQLRDAGLTVFMTDYAVGFEAIRRNILLLGELVGEDDAAEAMVEQMDAEIAAIGDLVGGSEIPPRVLYLTPGNYTSGAESTIAEIIEAAGGIDVSADAGLGQFAAVSDEFIIEANPDVILLTGWTPYDPTFVDQFFDNPAFADLDAIQNNRVYVVHDAHLTAVSQYVVDGVKDVAAYLWPQNYPDLPATLTDASGDSVTVEAFPNSVVVLDGASADALELVVSQYNEPQFDILHIDLEDANIGLNGDVVVFTTVPTDQLPPMSGADSYAYVQLYDGGTPAEMVENLEIIGNALANRIAAQNAIATYTDAYETAPGS